MQRARRRDPVPWTWEIPAFIVLSILTVLVLGVQFGRSVANVVAGAGWQWASSAELFTSLAGIIHGDARSGLVLGDGASVANTGLLWACVAVVEGVTIVAAFLLLKWFMHRWGPNRLRGMATRDEAEQLLGRSRLRKVAPVVRPDLYDREVTRR